MCLVSREPYLWPHTGAVPAWPLSNETLLLGFRVSETFSHQGTPLILLQPVKWGYHYPHFTDGEAEALIKMVVQSHMP